jgi:hypothetical protein
VKFSITYLSSNAHTAGTDRQPEFTPLAQLLGQSRTKWTKEDNSGIPELSSFVFGLFTWNNRKNF